MIRPDLRIIMENMLMSEGFMRARQLSIKFFELYDLRCDERREREREKER